MKKETLKTLWIVVLCGLGLFMLWGLWLEDMIISGEGDLATVEPRQLEYLIGIKAMNVSFGGGRITSFLYDREGIFNAFKPGLVLGLSNVASVTQVTENQYYTHRLAKSLEFDLVMPMTQSELLTVLSSSDLTGQEITGDIQKFLFVARETNQFWIATSEGFFIVESRVPLQDSNAAIELMSTDDMAVAFQTVEKRFALPPARIVDGEAVFNNVLVPQFSLPVILPISISRSEAQESIDAQREMAKRVFGNPLNFVQEAVDVNESKVFLYGYGDKALRISKDGIIEYSERFNDQLKKNFGLSDSLTIAIDMLEKLGGDIDSLVISDIEGIVHEDVKGFRFSFEYTLNNYLILSTDQVEGAVVEVYGGRVKSLYSNLYQYDTFHSLTNEQTQKLEMDDAQFFNMLSQLENFNTIAEDYYNDHPELVPSASAVERAQPVLNAIRDVYVGFYIADDQRMEPAVVLNLGKRTYYIDFYSYKMIKKN